uniref:Uncharacterized protein n=1 Tax=Anguilla anguilla TaxID=7936 RepID=A0A0E9UDZ4_ANGAN
MGILRQILKTLLIKGITVDLMEV